MIFMAAQKKSSKGSGGGSGSRAAGGTTVVTLAGDNSRPQTLFIPAGSRTGSSLSTTTGTAIQTSGRVGTPTALPQTPARLARRGGNAPQAAGSNGQIMVDLTQNFFAYVVRPRARCAGYWRASSRTWRRSSAGRWTRSPQTAGGRPYA